MKIYFKIRVNNWSVMININKFMPGTIEYMFLESIFEDFSFNNAFFKMAQSKLLNSSHWDKLLFICCIIFCIFGSFLIFEICWTLITRFQCVSNLYYDSIRNMSIHKGAEFLKSTGQLSISYKINKKYNILFEF